MRDQRIAGKQLVGGCILTPYSFLFLNSGDFS
jgi:hypothetical protein